MPGPFTDKGAGKTALHTYTSIEDLYTNALIKRDSFVMIRDAGGEFVYYIPESGANSITKTLINVETGQNLPMSNFIDKPISIERVPESRALSSYGVWARSAKYAKEAISKGVGFYGVNVESNAYSRAMQMMQSEEHKLSSSVRRALGEASEMTAKRVASVDFETGVPMAMEGRAGNLQSKMMVFTGAMSETTDYMVHLKGSPDGLSEMRVRENRAVEYFDIDTARAWVKRREYSSDAFFQDEARGVDYMFGKRNFAILMDVARERRMKRLKARMDKSAAARAEYERLQNMGSLLEKHIKEGKGATGESITEFRNRYRMFRSDMRNMIAGAIRNERQAKSRNIDPSDSTRHSRYTTYKSIGRISYQSMLGTDEAQMTTTEYRLTSDVTGALAEDMAEYTARTGQNVNAFGSLEADILRQKMAELRLIVGGTGSEEHKAAAQALHEKIGKALNHINDVKSLSQLFLHDYLPDMQKMAQTQRTVFDKVAERMGIHGEAKSEILNALEINPKNPFTRGFSLEQLIRTMHNAKDYKEYHVASLDSSDLNAYVEMLDRIKEGSDVIKRSKSLTGNSTQYFKYGVEAVQENLWETSARFATDVNSKTMASMIMEKMDSKTIAKILRKGNLTALPRTLENFAARRIGGTSTTGFEVSEALTNLIKQNSKAVIDDLVSDQYKESQRRIHLNSQPGFLSRILSTQHIPRIFAFYAAAQLMRTPDGIPQNGQEGIDRGEHASIATIARRISTTDFGSPVSSFAPKARELIGSVLKKSMNILRRGTLTEGVERASAVATTKGTAVVSNIVHPENLKWAALTAEQKGFMEARDPTMRMVVESAEARVAKQVQGTPGGYLVASMRDKTEKQLAYEHARNYRSIMAARGELPWEKDPNKFALLETTQKVDKHMISLKSNKRSYRTSPYGDTAISEHTRMPVEKWMAEQQTSPGHQWNAMQRTRFTTPLERAVREDATVDAGRKLGSFQKRIMTGAETIAQKQRLAQRELAADMMRTDYSDGIHIPVRKMPPGVMEMVEVYETTKPVHGIDVKNAVTAQSNQWVAQEMRTDVFKKPVETPLYTPEGTRTSLDMSPAAVPLKKPEHRVMSAQFSNRKEKLPVLPIISVPKAPLEMPVIMPTNVGPAGIAPLKVPRNQAPNAAYHELFTMNMRTRKSNGWESNQRMIDMAMAGMPR